MEYLTVVPKIALIMGANIFLMFKDADFTSPKRQVP